MPNPFAFAVRCIEAEARGFAPLQLKSAHEPQPRSPRLIDPSVSCRFGLASTRLLFDSLGFLTRVEENRADSLSKCLRS